MVGWAPKVQRRPKPSKEQPESAEELKSGGQGLGDAPKLLGTRANCSPYHFLWIPVTISKNSPEFPRISLCLKGTKEDKREEGRNNSLKMPLTKDVTWRTIDAQAVQLQSGTQWIPGRPLWNEQMGVDPRSDAS